MLCGTCEAHTMKEHEPQGHRRVAAVLEVQPVDLLVMGAYGGSVSAADRAVTTSRFADPWSGAVARA